MAIKIITCDMDGTLMSEDHLTVSQRTRDALAKAHSQGVKITISTGRTLAIIGDVCEQVPQIDYVMYSNGAAVLDRKVNKNIYSNLIADDVAKQMLEFLNKYNIFYEVYVDGFSYAQSNKIQYYDDDYLPKEFFENLKNRINFVDNLVETLDKKEVEKVTLYCVSDDLMPIMVDFFESLDITVASSFKSSIEMTAKNSDKGTALAGMCKKLGITHEESMTFGDAQNDCTMLEWADYSFAMGNGTPECKASAKYETLSNAQDGVAVAVEKYVIK